MKKTRQQLKEIFLDTLKLSTDYEEYTHYYTDAKASVNIGNPTVEVVDMDSLTACETYEGDVLLNFASGWTPGGGVTKGYSAQEENLCQRTTLYKSITGDNAKEYYINTRNCNNPNLGLDHCIVSKQVTILKDNSFNLIEPEKRYTIPIVLSIPAPRLKEGKPCSDEQLEAALESRIRFIIVKSIEESANLEKKATLILGAWGCGIYKNDPNQVARLFKEQIQLYGGYFDKIIFAIPKGRNYTIFKKTFGV